MTTESNYKTIEDLRTLKVGQTVYRTQQNECSEGWSEESYHKSEVKNIIKSNDGFFIVFDDGRRINASKDGKDIYRSYQTLFKTKGDIMKYISSEILC